MIKIIFCLRRRDHLTLEAFHDYWLEQHAPLVRQVAPILRIRRYTQSRLYDNPLLASTIKARGCDPRAFDGVAELWWDSAEDIIAAGATPEGRAAGRRLLADEKTFIDLPNSFLFYAEEYQII